MSNEPKLTDGWEEYKDTWSTAGKMCLLANLECNNENYEYRVIRRKKEEPMPNLWIGDAIIAGLQHNHMVVISTDLGVITAVDMYGNPKTPFLPSVSVIYRDGKEIWRRKA